MKSNMPLGRIHIFDLHENTRVIRRVDALCQVDGRAFHAAANDAAGPLLLLFPAAYRVERIRFHRPARREEQELALCIDGETREVSKSFVFTPSLMLNEGIKPPPRLCVQSTPEHNQSKKGGHEQSTNGRDGCILLDSA